VKYEFHDHQIRSVDQILTPMSAALTVDILDYNINTTYPVYERTLDTAAVFEGTTHIIVFSGPYK